MFLKKVEPCKAEALHNFKDLTRPFPTSTTEAAISSKIPEPGFKGVTLGLRESHLDSFDSTFPEFFEMRFLCSDVKRFLSSTSTTTSTSLLAPLHLIESQMTDWHLNNASVKTTVHRGAGFALIELCRLITSLIWLINIFLNMTHLNSFFWLRGHEAFVGQTKHEYSKTNRNHNYIKRNRKLNFF